MVWLNNKVIFQPLQKLMSLASEISKGNFKKNSTSKKMKLGDVYHFDHPVSFLLNIAGASEKIADGDLIVSVEPQSEEDTLSKSINQMVVKLKEKISVFIEIPQIG